MTWVFEEYSNLPEKFGKKAYELALLERECRVKKREFYCRRISHEKVDENLIKQIEELNSRIAQYQHSLMKRQEHVREILEEFDSHLDEIDLKEIQAALK